MAETSTYTEDPTTKRKEYSALRAQLMNDRSSFEAHWRDLADFIKPRRTRWFPGDKNRGDKRNQKIIDSTGTFCADTLRSGMHAGLTSPARPWFRLTTPDPDLAEYRPVKEWLHTVTQRMLVALLKSNAYQVFPTVYGDMGVFGTGAMSIMEDDKTLFRCYSYPIGSYALGVDDKGRVNTFIRNYTMTVRDIVKKFGVVPGTKTIDWSRISSTVRNMWERSDYAQTVEVCWIVTPNENHDPTQILSKYLPYHSCWFEAGSDQVGNSQSNANVFLREKGFNEFPVMAPRWETTGEDTYGTECPGMTALGDVKQLQVGERRSLQAVEKMINPPLQAPTSLMSKNVSSLPGEVSYVDQMQGQHGIRAIHEVNFAVEKLEEKQAGVRERLRSAFYTDLFLMMAYSDRREITAREVEERHEEKLLALGPVLERSKDELHEPAIDRVYAMMDREGLIPDAPPELQGVGLKVEYLSLMASAQKLINVSAHERFLEGTKALAEVWPEARHKVDINQAIEEYGDMLSVNPKIVRSDDEANAALAAEQKAASAEMQSKAMRNNAASAKDLSQTEVTGDTALTRIIDAARSGV